MEEKTKNLCAQIPESLHTRVLQEKDLTGQTLSQYMTTLLTNYYNDQKGTTKMDNTRTMAFQIPEELFQELKKYLKKHNLKQKDFVLGLIQQALADDRDAEAPQMPQALDAGDNDEGGAV